MPTIIIRKGNERKIGVAILLFAVVAVAMTEVIENIIFTTIGIVIGIVFGVLGLYFLSGAPFLRTHTKNT